MPTKFQDFLSQKAEGTDIRDRRQNREQWLAALRQLLDEIEGWLWTSDPEQLLEKRRYVVERVEERLGIYDAPALEIRFGTHEVDVVPVGRYSIGPLPAQVLQSLPGVEGTTGPAAGRVDITNGENKYLLLRSTAGGKNRWFALDERLRVLPFDQGHLETILLELWS